MPTIGDLGVAFGYSKNKGWSLTSIDDPSLKFFGQFPAENLQENVGVRQNETTTPGQSTPLIQFSSGEVETITFRGRIFRTSPVSGVAADALSNPVGTAFNVAGGGGGPLLGNSSVKDQLEKLKEFARKSEALGRNHRCSLVIGSELKYLVFCRSVGNISYDEIRSDGTIRGASFDLLFTKIDPKEIAAPTGVTTAAKIATTLGIVTTVAGGIRAVNAFRRDKLVNIPGGSLHTIDKFLQAKQGDTYEKVAAREYGNAMLGVTLRLAQPDKPELKENDEYLTVARREIVQIPIEPRAVALRPNTETKLLLDAYLALRGQPASIVV